MLTEPTLEKLKKLNLFAMAEAWTMQKQDAQAVSLDFDTRLGMLVDAEQLCRDNKRLTRLIREAKLRLSAACVEDIDTSAKREIDRALLRELATCRWIVEHQNVVITGATGTGKTYFACALAMQACRHGKRALYTRVPRLIEEMTIAHADGSFSRLLTKLSKVDVLILDDWALTPLRDQDRRDILEVLEDRHAMRSTIFTSQLPSQKWHEFLIDPTVADAICDRVLHNAHRVALKGPSKRKEAARAIEQ